MCVLAVVLAGLVQQDLPQMPGFSLVEHFQFSAYAHLHRSWGELNPKRQPCSPGGCAARQGCSGLFVHGLERRVENCKHVKLRVQKAVPKQIKKQHRLRVIFPCLYLYSVEVANFYQ